MSGFSLLAYKPKLERFADRCVWLSAKEARQNKDLRPRSDSIGTRTALVQTTRSILLAFGGVLSSVNVSLAENDLVGLTDLPDKIVVVERRPSAIVNAPLSVARISSSEIDLVGADHANEILSRVPGVFIHRGSGQEHLTAIRSPVLTGGAGAGSFLFLQDGVPLRSAGFANVNALFEAHTEIASAIDVVRGPSGAVYGSNAIHGAIDVRTPDPSAFTGGGVFSLSGDTIGRIKGAAEIGWSGSGALRDGYAAVSILDDPGFRADSGVDQQKITFRQRHTLGSATATTSVYFNNLNQETAGFIEGDDVYLDPIIRRTNPNPEAFRDARAFRLASTIDAPLSENTNLIVTPYFRWTDMDFLLFFLPSQALEENRHWSFGVQSAVYHDRDNFSFFAGLDLERTTGFLTEFQSIPTTFSFTQGLHYDYEVDALSASPFAGIDWRLNNRLTARLAVRGDYTRYNYDNRTDSGVVGRFLRPDDRVDDFFTASPKASLTYNVDDTSLYVAFAIGARPPQTTDLYRLQINQTTDPAEPETITSVEGGIRSRIGPATFNLVGFAMEKDNFFFRDADGFNVPDGVTRHIGGEADINIEIMPSLILNADIAYGRHTYRFSRDVERDTEVIVFGNVVDTSPRWLVGTRLLWTPENTPFTAEASWRYVSEYFTDAANDNSYPGHDIIDLRAGWRFSDRVEIFGALRNVANTFYAERADFAFGSARFFPGEGRVLTMGVRVTR